MQKKNPSKVAGHRFQTSIGVVSTEVNVAFQYVQCEICIFFPITDQKSTLSAAFSLGNVLLIVLYMSMQMYMHVILL